MKVYMSRRQAEQIVIAMMATFGSKDEDSLQVIQRINNVLLYQCKHDKSHYAKKDNKIEKIRVG